MKKRAKNTLPFADVILAPFVYSAAWFLKGIRRVGVSRLPRCKSALLNIGIFPIRKHYYEPQFDNRQLRSDLSHDRPLHGIDWNVPGQLSCLESYTHSQELLDLPREPQQGALEFYLDNGSFESGDAECWYQMIRAKRPRRIIEIGGGNSTLMAIRAIKETQKEDPGYRCEHVCIEPFENPWLEDTGIPVIRKKAEEIELSFFARLQENDILFIDSSHIIRPQGDVLFEYLELLPSLNKGVIVHVHDIFSPKDYPKKWLVDDVRFWNEQYLLEAFLSHNHDWRVLCALNFLYHNHYEELKLAAPFLSPGLEPGSFYIQKTA